MPVSTMDDWVCNSCGASVFGARLECFKCGQEWQNNPILSSDSESDSESDICDDENELPICLQILFTLKNKEDASKKFHVIDEEFLRFNRPECFLTSFYEESKNMAKLRKHDALGRIKQLPNKPVLIHSPIEVLPIVYDTILYHDEDGNISSLTPPWFLVPGNKYKITEGGNRIHLPCEQCQYCNAIF